jgi:hypothetical protein
MKQVEAQFRLSWSDNAKQLIGPFLTRWLDAFE